MNVQLQRKKSFLVTKGSKEVTMSKHFTVIIQKEDDWYIAKCLENSVASHGKTMDEATDNLREALALFYEDESLPAFTDICNNA